MFGLIAMARQSGAGGSTSEPPGGEMLPDPDFNNPSAWNTNGNAVVSGGTIMSNFSLTPGAVPTITVLTAPTESGKDYTLTIVALANPLGGRPQTQLFNSGTSASQLVYNGIPEFTTVEVPVTANAVYDQLRIVWTEEAITLDRLSLVPAA